MIVDLNALTLSQADEIIKWCVANRIDYDRANELRFAWYENPPLDHTWELDIPDEYLTYFKLKWTE